jgi:hypothetical protein
MSVSLIIKQALENTVLCRGAHSSKESYEYAARMEGAIKKTLRDRLQVILNNPKTVEEDLKKLIAELDT